MVSLFLRNNAQASRPAQMNSLPRLEKCDFCNNNLKQVGLDPSTLAREQIVQGNVAC